jgi:hypothetical protein
MLGSETLDIAIGIIFVFLMVSIICAAIREGIESWLKTRAAYLEFGIRELLHDPTAKGLAKHFFEHPLIYGLFAKEYAPQHLAEKPGLLANGNNLPSYIPSKNFARALMDLAARGPETNVESSDSDAHVLSPKNIRTNILNLGNPAVQRVLLIALDSSKDDLNVMQNHLEEWYNSGMDRVSGWYKRSTSWVLFWIGLFVSISLNINIITVANHLYRDKPARLALVARAQATLKDSTFMDKSYQQTREELSTLSLPLGWDRADFGWPGSVRTGYVKTAGKWKEVKVERGLWNYVVLPILGWLFTALAVTMGAPFWFDLLNKFMVIRSTVKPHEKSLEENSEDR